MPDGKIHCLPLVKVVTAHAVNLPGFYGIERIIPSGLHENECYKAIEAAEKAIKALKLRSTTAHVELFRTNAGWKIIEVAPRIGGFRDVLYREAFGIEHYFNDLSIRMGINPVINRQAIASAAVLNIYPDNEGYIESISDIEKVEQLESVIKLDINADLGELSLFATNGGNPVVEIVLSNVNMDNLNRDILEARKTIKIKTNYKII